MFSGKRPQPFELAGVACTEEPVVQLSLTFDPCLLCRSLRDPRFQGGSHAGRVQGRCGDECLKGRVFRQGSPRFVEVAGVQYADGVGEGWLGLVVNRRRGVFSGPGQGFNGIAAVCVPGSLRQKEVAELRVVHRDSGYRIWLPDAGGQQQSRYEQPMASYFVTNC